MLSASKVFLLSTLNAVPQSETALVGARGFEPPTSRTRTVRASRTALRPVREHYTPSMHTLQESTNELQLQQSRAPIAQPG